MVSFRSALAKRGSTQLRVVAARLNCFGFATILSLLTPCLLEGEEPSQVGSDAALVDSWLTASSKVRSWSADFVQTRRLKTLARPLTAEGRVWFEAPNSFRWELGNPPRTIAVRNPKEMLVIYPRLKRAERYPAEDKVQNSWSEALALLQVAWVQSRSEFDERYRLLSMTPKEKNLELLLEPRSKAAQKLIRKIKIEVSISDFAPRATELEFADGSLLRNDFSNCEVNPSIDSELFTPQLDSCQRRNESG